MTPPACPRALAPLHILLLGAPPHPASWGCFPKGSEPWQSGSSRCKRKGRAEGADGVDPGASSSTYRVPAWGQDKSFSE